MTMLCLISIPRRLASRPSVAKAVIQTALKSTSAVHLNGALRASSHSLLRQRNHHQLTTVSLRQLSSQPSNSGNSGVSLEPYVDPVYSYAYGRSTGALIYKTINQSLSDVVHQNPDRICVISHHQGIQKTYRQLQQDIDRLAVSLWNLGLRKGDVAGAWSANVYEYLLIQYACTKIGVINCSINPAYKSAELEYALEKAKHKVLFLPTRQSRQSCINDFHGVMQKVDFTKTPSLRHLVFLESTDSDLVRWSDAHFPHTFESLLTNDGELPPEAEGVVIPEDLATIYFTSGTTGKPKGAMSSQFSIINNIRIAKINKLGVSDKEDMTTLCPLPFFHVYAGMIGIFSLATGPSTIVINDVRYSAKSVVECISKYKCTDVWTVPTMLVDIHNFLKKKKGSYDVSSITRVGCGAAPVPVEVAKESKQLFPSLNTVIVGYGATETSAVATYPTPGTPQEVVCETVGTPQDFTQIKIVDSEGRLVKHGETGEILIKGFSIMKGYLDDEEKTNESIKHGWYYTGDLGTMDSEGKFKIVGRTKEMIIRGGENIYPREIEELLHTHPDVLEVAVCGVPHPKLGEEVCAWVQLVDNSKISAEEIRQFCRTQITYFKVPQHVFFVDSFPVTGSGKFQKFIMTEKSVEMLKRSQQRSHEYN